MLLVGQPCMSSSTGALGSPISTWNISTEEAPSSAGRHAKWPPRLRQSSARGVFMIPTPFGRLRGPAWDPRIGANFARFGLSPVTSRAAAVTAHARPRAGATVLNPPRTKYLILGTLWTFSRPSRRGASQPQDSPQLPVNAGGAAGSTFSQQHIGPESGRAGAWCGAARRPGSVPAARPPASPAGDSPHREPPEARPSP